MKKAKSILRALIAHTVSGALRGLLLLCQTIGHTLYFVLKPFSALFPDSTNLQKLQNRARPWMHDDIFLSASEVISKESDYAFEEHEVVTDDGYVLTAWRLYRKECAPGARYEHPVFLMHGLLDCAFSWFALGAKEHCLPYMLADMGADVWIGNNRGNRYSRGHKHLDAKRDERFWDYALDELARYDVPAQILYVKRATQKEQVVYIGHSQGTAQFFANACLDPDFLQRHVRAFVGLGPAIYVAKINSQFVCWLLECGAIDCLKALGCQHLLGYSFGLSQTIAQLCYYLPDLLTNAIFGVINLLVGLPHKNRLPKERVPVIVRHEPGGTSFRNLLQWVQFRNSGQFTMYDFGPEENVRRYGQEAPPAYKTDNLKSLTMEKHLFVGIQDTIANLENVQRMVQHFDSSSTHVHTLEDFAHLCYAWGREAHKVLYPRILDIVQKHAK